VLHEPRQKLVSVNHGQLSAILRALYVDAFRHQPRPKGIPVGQRGDENDAFAVRQRGRRKATDYAIEEVLILVEMHDVIARGGVRQNVVPRFAVT
jgi:hypothetical protein